MCEELYSVSAVVIYLEQLRHRVYGIKVTIGSKSVGKVEVNAHT